MKKRKPTPRKGARPPEGQPRRKPTRREMIATAASWGAVAAAVGGIGIWTVGSVRATISEQDLSRVGNGTPSVVQVHDPNCRICQTLQTETRAALETLEDGALTYMVANIETSEGRAFAAEHGVGHVTLLLFDRHGRLRTTLEGAQDREALATAFARHLRRFGS